MPRPHSTGLLVLSCPRKASRFVGGQGGLSGVMDSSKMEFCCLHKYDVHFEKSLHWALKAGECCGVAITPPRRCAPHAGCRKDAVWGLESTRVPPRSTRQHQPPCTCSQGHRELEGPFWPDCRSRGQHLSQITRGSGFHLLPHTLSRVHLGSNMGSTVF